MSPRRSTSMRFSDQETELLDAVAAVLQHKTSVDHSRTDVVRVLLRKLSPSAEAGAENLRHRDAYQKVFGS